LGGAHERTSSELLSRPVSLLLLHVCVVVCGVWVFIISGGVYIIIILQIGLSL
jgi:hypothetical protein